MINYEYDIKIWQKLRHYQQIDKIIPGRIRDLLIYKMDGQEQFL